MGGVFLDPYEPSLLIGRSGKRPSSHWTHTDGDWTVNTSFYLLTAEIGRGFFNAFARIFEGDDARAPADQRYLMAVLLFVAIGLLLTAAFFMLGFGVEFGRILSAT
jgi:hypothetical protein